MYIVIKKDGAQEVRITTSDKDTKHYIIYKSPQGCYTMDEQTPGQQRHVKTWRKDRNILDVMSEAMTIVYSRMK